MPLKFLLLFAVLAGQVASGAETRESGQKFLAKMESIHREQARSRHPFRVRELELELKGFGARFRKLGLKSVPLLGWYAGQKERPAKLRVYAAVFLGVIGDPAAFGALSALVRDGAQDPGLRSAALQSVGSLRRLMPADKRPLLDFSVASGMPETLVREALSQLAVVGTDEVERVRLAARRFGAAPQGVARGSAGHAVEALGRSLCQDADAALFYLLRYFKGGSPLRVKALQELSRRRLASVSSGGMSHGRPLRRKELDFLGSLLVDEKGRAAVLAARLLGGAMDPRADRHLLKALRGARDPAVLAEAAESLLSAGGPEGVAAVRRLASGILRDSRFRPIKGGPDSGEYAVRIEEAVAALARPTSPTPPLKTRTFGYEGWPGEGKPLLAWDGSQKKLLLRGAPAPSAKKAGWVFPKKGEELRYDASLVLTLRVGKALFGAENASFVWRSLGPLERLTREQYYGSAERRTVELIRGETLEVLSYRAEGRCFVRLEREVYEASCPQNDRERFEVLSEPVVEWWLRMTRKDTTGWFRAEQKGIEFLPREF